jgi:hypothetical protein
VSFPGTSFDNINDKCPLDSPPGAFDYDFGALDNLDNPLTKSYTHLLYSTFGTMTRGRFLVMNLCQYLPGWSVQHIFEAGSGPGIQKIRENRDHAHRVGRELIEQKRRQIVVGQPEKDVLSLLGASHRVSPHTVAKIDSLCIVKANDSKDAHSKLRDDEIIPQIRTLMLAGHETVSKTVSKLNALSRGMISDNPHFVDDIWTVGACEAARDPEEASGRSHGNVQGNQGPREGGLHVGRYRWYGLHKRRCQGQSTTL